MMAVLIFGAAVSAAFGVTVVAVVLLAALVPLCVVGAVKGAARREIRQRR